MLSIGRNIGQTISIGKAGDVLTGPIIVKVCHAKKSHVRLGVEAQRGVIVIRPDRKPLFPAKEGDEPESKSPIATAYPCHCCGKAECRDKKCCGEKREEKLNELRAAAGVYVVIA